MLPDSNAYKVLAAWGPSCPAWVQGLAKACDETSQNQVASQLGVSSATVSKLINAKYPGDVEEMAKLVKARLLGGEIECPATGAEISHGQCLDYRRGTRLTGPEWRTLLGRTCPSCIHNADAKGVAA